MNKKIKVAVMGSGHIGTYAIKGIQITEDMQLVGIVELASMLEKTSNRFPGVEVVDNVSKLSTKPDVVLMACPTRTVQQEAPKILKLGISTVDCFDMHGEPFNSLRATLDPLAKENHVVSIMGAGVDPGACSMIRALFEMWSPTGLTYVNFGPGMSMGHTVAVKTFAGVKDAYSVTRPGRPGVNQRDVYIETEPGTDFKKLTEEIMKDSYFCHDDVHFFEVEKVAPLIDMGHRINVTRKGGSCGIDNQLLEFDSHFHNPASTAQVLISTVRAATRLAPGAHLMLEIPLIDFLPYTIDEALKKLV